MENIIAEHVNEAAGELVQQDPKNIDCGAEVCTCIYIYIRLIRTNYYHLTE